MHSKEMEGAEEAESKRWNKYACACAFIASMISILMGYGEFSCSKNSNMIFFSLTVLTVY